MGSASPSLSSRAAKAAKKGNGLTHSDTTLQGAQANGERVKVEAGRNLTLTSEQDSDRYDSRQQSGSAGGSFTFGSMTGSANVSLSRDKLHSNWQGVAEQTGIDEGGGVGRQHRHPG